MVACSGSEKLKMNVDQSTAGVSDYFELSKPLIILLLLLSALTGMIIAEQGLPQIHLIATVLVAGALASAGANAINNFMDRDIDTVMSRTKSRPVAGSRVSPTNALIFGIVRTPIKQRRHSEV